MTATASSFAPIRPNFLAGSDDPRACLERYLARIEAREKDITAFAALNIEGARKAADESAARYRAGKPLSEIDGMPLGIKDIIETEDMPTGFGSPIFDGWRGGRDAAAVMALREAGAVIVGKTVTTEFAAFFPGPTRNPRDTTRTPGGSSSGSAAAVADGMLPAALGSQVVGSILRPASFCGVVGFKPSFGALNRGGGSIDNFSQNCLGALANSLDDIWAICHAIVERVGGDPGCAGFAGGAAPAPAHKPGTLGVIETAGWSAAAPEAREALSRFVSWAERQDVRIVRRRDLPELQSLESAIADAVKVTLGINAREFVWPLRMLAKKSEHLLSPHMRERLAVGNAMTEAEYQGLLAQRQTMRVAQRALHGEIGALVTLSAPGPAPVGLTATGNPVFNAPATALGAPAISLPLFEVDGMPVGLQIIGFPGEDRALSGIANWALGFAAR